MDTKDHSEGVQRAHFSRKIAQMGPPLVWTDPGQHHIRTLHWSGASVHFITPKKPTKFTFSCDTQLTAMGYKQFTRPIELRKGDTVRIKSERGRFVARVYRNGRCITVRRTER